MRPFQNLLLAGVIFMAAPSALLARPEPAGSALPVMPPHEFKGFLETLKKTPEEKAGQLLNGAIKKNRFTSKQIADLADTTSSQTDQADIVCHFAKHDRVADPENWSLVINSRTSPRAQERIIECAPKGAQVSLTEKLVMPPHEFKAFLEQFRKTPEGEVDKLLKGEMKKHRFTSKQIADLADTTSSQSDQAGIVCYIAKQNRVADPENWSLIVKSRTSQRAQERITACAPKGAQVSAAGASALPVMAPQAFKGFLAKVQKTRDSELEAVLNSAIQKNRFSCQQIAALADTRGFYGDQADVACYFAQKQSVADPENWPMLVRSRKEPRGQELVARCAPKGVQMPPHPPVPPRPQVSAMSSTEFEALSAAVQKENFDKNKVSRLREAGEKHHFTADQVKTLIQLLSFDGDRAESACFLAGRVIDRENWPSVAEVLNFKDNRQKVLDCGGSK